MNSKQAINTEKAPKALPGIYNQAIVANGTVYCSGSIGMSPSTGEMVSGDIQDRTHQIMENLTHVLEAAGSSLEHVVKVSVFIADMADFAKMNEAYSQYFGDIKPSRTCVAAKQLPFGTDVEIDCIATLA